MKSKLIGYILIAAGILLLIVSLGIWKIDLPIPESIKPIYVSIAGLVFAIIGAFLGFSKSEGKTEQKQKEVPIYKGKEIVGYRQEK